MKSIIVNEQDQIIGHKERADKTPDDISRVSALWIYNSQNEVLIAQRSWSKKLTPGKWGPAVAGTVEEGETYLSNIIKETKEEIGISLQEEQLAEFSHKFQDSSHKYFCQYFIAKIDLPIEKFTIQKDEVEQVRWISIDELSTWVKEDPDQFVKSLPSTLSDFIEYKKGVVSFDDPS